MNAVEYPAARAMQYQRAQLFQRHDLVWLDDGAVWVVARRSEEDLAAATLRLGRCTAAASMPGRAARVAGSAREEQVLRHRAALRIDEIVAALNPARMIGADLAQLALPTAWHSVLAELQSLERRFGLALRIYGSLAWQTLTALGELGIQPNGFIHGASDLDVLVDVGARLLCDGATRGTDPDVSGLLAALAALSQRSVAAGGPRLDGEVRLPACADVAWREWLETRNGPVLCKDAVRVRLRAPCLSASQPQPTPAELDWMACQALRREALAWPKPGLVSPIDMGSHSDMDIALLLRAIDALQGWFGELARAARHGARFADLAAIGRCAEDAMLRATGGINAYKGAIFNLGLLVAASAVRRAEESPAACVARLWSAALLQHRVGGTSHGAQVRARDGAGGAVREAAQGFPTLMHRILPAWRAAPDARALQTACLAGIAYLEDTNLLWRGGVEGLQWAQTQARQLLDSGVLDGPDWEYALAQLHLAFVARRLSPGGSADLAACAAFLIALE